MNMFATLLATLAFRFSFGVTITVDLTIELIVHETRGLRVNICSSACSGHNVLRYALLNRLVKKR